METPIVDPENNQSSGAPEPAVLFEASPITSPIPAPPPQKEHGLVWLGAGAVLSCASIRFYRKAIQRSIGPAILFFFLFTLVISILSFSRFDIMLTDVVREMQDDLASTNIPEITISNGHTTIQGSEQTIVLSNAREIFFAIDTTGRYTGIDASRYDNGILITRDEMIVLSSSKGIQTLSLSDFNAAFGDPVVINNGTISTLFNQIGAVLEVLAVVGIWCWNFILRLMIIASISLLFWGIASLIRPGTRYSSVLITGLYCFVPATYIDLLLEETAVPFFGMFTLIHLALWVLVMFLVKNDLKKPESTKPYQWWRALIGIPMVCVLGTLVILNTTGMAIAAWAVTAISVIAIAAFGIVADKTDEMSATPPAIG